MNSLVKHYCLQFQFFSDQKLNWHAEGLHFYHNIKPTPFMMSFRLHPEMAVAMEELGQAGAHCSRVRMA